MLYDLYDSRPLQGSEMNETPLTCTAIVNPVVILGLSVLLNACSGITSDQTDLLNNISIPVTRPQCTPFGNPPRPRNDTLTDSAQSNTQCAGGGSRLPDFVDNNGTTRRACIFDPGTASAQHKLPLVVYLQGSGVPSDPQLPLSTNVLDGLATADLTGDPARKGFILVEPVGRVTDHYYPAPNDTNTVGWDVWYRQFSSTVRFINGESFAPNADAVTIDHYIAAQLATGKIDSDRIYILGWSNGAALALLYGQHRSNVAAVAMYSGPDPYDSLSDPCGQRPTALIPNNDTALQISNPGIPVFHIHNDCDIYATCPNALVLNAKLLATRTAVFTSKMINGVPSQQVATICNASCGTDPRGDANNNLANTLGLENHLTWPKNYTVEYFNFLRDHPLGTR